MMSKLATAPRSREASTDTIDFILDAHFESFAQPNINTLIRVWGEEGRDLEGQQQAVLCIYQAANYSREEFALRLLDIFGGECESLEREGLKESHRFLNKLSKQCNGQLAENNDPILSHCSGLCSLNVVEIERHVGEYFRNKTNSYLQEQHPEIYETIQRMGVGNHSYSEIFPERRTPSESVSSTSGSQLESRFPANDI